MVPESRLAMALLYAAGGARLLWCLSGFTSGALQHRHAAGGVPLAAGPAWLAASMVPFTYLAGSFVLSVGVPARRRSDRAPAVEVAANGAVCGILPFAAVLRAAIRARYVPNAYMKMAVLFADADPADDGLRHRALPADGRRHHLPPRLRIHAGDVVRAGGILRNGLSLGSLVQKNSKIWATPA